MARKAGFDLKTVTMAEVLLLLIFGMVIAGSSQLEDLRKHCVVPPDEVSLGGFDLGDPAFWNRCIDYDLLDEENKLLLAEMAEKDARIEALTVERNELERRLAELQEKVATETDGATEAEEVWEDERALLLARIAELEAGNLELQERVQDAQDEIARLQAQIGALEESLGDEAGRGGRDYPSCWSKPDEYLLVIEVSDDGLDVVPNWPQDRTRAIEEMGYDRVDFTEDRTVQEWAGIFNRALSYADEHNCRFFVEVSDNTQDKNNWFPVWNVLYHFFYILVHQ